MFCQVLLVALRCLRRGALANHVSVAAGVLLVATALAAIPSVESSAPRGESAGSALSGQARAGAAVVDAAAGSQGRENRASVRGDRPTSTPTEPAKPAPAAPSPSPAPPAPAAPAPTAAPLPPTAVPTPLPTDVPPPPSPAPARPTPAPTPAPAPPPPPAPAPRLRVGIQAGHWKTAELPAELASLRRSTGAAGSGWREVDVTLDVAQRVAAKLRERGIAVDVLPATVPVDYGADAFVSIHGDANGNPSASGYKLARATWSKIPLKDDALIQAIYAEYGAATGMKTHNGSITEDMRQYYAFNWPKLDHAVGSTTPAAIIELGFLTSASDRGLLLDQPDRAATGIANGISRFLGAK